MTLSPDWLARKSLAEIARSTKKEGGPRELSLPQSMRSRKQGTLFPRRGVCKCRRDLPKPAVDPAQPCREAGRKTDAASLGRS